MVNLDPRTYLLIMVRQTPNILIVGTPGTGKTTLASIIAEKSDLKHVNVSELSSDKRFLDEFDEERQCYVLDEEKLLDYMEVSFQSLLLQYTENCFNINVSGRTLDQQWRLHHRIPRLWFLSRALDRQGLHSTVGQYKTVRQTESEKLLAGKDTRKCRVWNFRHSERRGSPVVQGKTCFFCHKIISLYL